MNIKILNLSLNITESDLRKVFVQYGNVDEVKVHKNSLNGRPLKSGEVSMPVLAQAKQAIASLDKTLLDGQIISVNEIPPELR